jgi:hypothetical protein
VPQPSSSDRSAGADARALALVDEFGSQIAKLGTAGPKIVEVLAMVRFSTAAVPEREAIPFKSLRKVVESDLETKLRDVFSEVEERPLAVGSLGQVHRAQTLEGDDVALKVQHPGVADAIGRDLRNIGVVAPILGRIAPGLDAGALLAELRERVSDEVDYEVEAQHQRRIERLFRGHPHIRIPRVRTDLSTRRVLVSEYLDAPRLLDVVKLDQGQRDRVGEIVFRFFFGLVRHAKIVAGDPAAENLLLCPDGRVGVVDFGLVRDLDAGYLEGERQLLQAIAEQDVGALHDGLTALGYLPEPEAFEPAALLEHLTAGAWFLAPGPRRLNPEDADRTLELAYPPRTPWFGQLRRQRLPPPTLLARRMEAVLLPVLAELGAEADWGAISAEHWAGAGPSTALGREDRAFSDRRGG